MFDAFGDAPPVHRLELQRLEHQHVERALQQIASFPGHALLSIDEGSLSAGPFRLSKGEQTAAELTSRGGNVNNVYIDDPPG